MSLLAKIGLWMCAALFVLMAGVQYNDTDPFVWVPLYIYAAALSVWTVKWPVGIGFALFEAVVAIAVGGLILANEGLPIIGDSEVGREIGGVVILVLHAWFIARVARSPHSKWVDGRPIY